MLLVTALAVAGPLAPMSVDSTGISVAGAVGLDRDWLREPGCEGDGCEAVRHRAWQGFEVSGRLLRPLGAYARIDHAADTLSGASYSGEGWVACGGLQTGFQLRPSLSLDAWVGLTRAQTKGTKESSTRTDLEAGITLGAGSADDNVVGWVGVSGVPWSMESDVVVDGALHLQLEPAIPVSAVGGILFISEPLRGRPSKRGRLIAGVDGTAGFRTSLTGWAGAAF